MQDIAAKIQDADAQQVDDPDEGSDDEAGFVEDDNAPFVAGAGVEEIMQMLEEGGTLPDIEGLATAEDPQVCQAHDSHDMCLHLHRTVMKFVYVLDSYGPQICRAHNSCDVCLCLKQPHSLKILMSKHVTLLIFAHVRAELWLKLLRSVQHVTVSRTPT